MRGGRERTGRRWKEGVRKESVILAVESNWIMCTCLMLWYVGK